MENLDVETCCILCAVCKITRNVVALCVVVLQYNHGTTALWEGSRANSDILIVEQALHSFLVPRSSFLIPRSSFLVPRALRFSRAVLLLYRYLVHSNLKPSDPQTPKNLIHMLIEDSVYIKNKKWTMSLFLQRVIRR
jgi:hypothetical protein